MTGILTGIASTAVPMFLKSEMGQRLLSKVGLSSAMFSQQPSMDVYQRDYVTQGEMNYMGPSAVGHLQHAAMNGENIHVVKGRARPPTFRQNHIISTCHIYICFRCIIGVIILTRYVEEFRYSHNI